MSSRPLGILFCFSLGLPAAMALASVEVPAPPQRGPIALVGATIHPVTSRPIADGVLVFDRGRITALGRRGQVKLPAGARTLQVDGRHVYPGLLDAYTQLGLTEIKAVRATLDYRETGQLNPNVKAWVAVNPDSELIPVTRSNGVLLVLTAPRGGLISGRSAVLQLDGWTYEQLTLKADVGLHLHWPQMQPVVRWPEQRSPEEQKKQRDETLAKLRRFFDDARAYKRARQAAPRRHAIDARLEAMLPVLAGRMPLIVSADEIQQIQAAVAFAAEQRVRLIILGGYDAARCAALLKQHDVPVIVTAVYRLPQRRDDPYDAAFTLPERLRRAGVHFCISSDSTTNARNLPYHAATAVAFGLPRDEALKAVTLYPAQILGVADRVGSLEVGKDATLIVTDGDPLQTPTQVLAAFIQGRQIDLSDRHKRLWRKYQQKYRQLGR